MLMYCVKMFPHNTTSAKWMWLRYGAAYVIHCPIRVLPFIHMLIGYDKILFVYQFNFDAAIAICEMKTIVVVICQQCPAYHIGRRLDKISKYRLVSL